MRKFQLYFSGILIISSLLGFIMTLKNIGMSEAQYYGIMNDKWKTTLGENLTGIFLLGLIIQVFVYIPVTIYHLYYGLFNKTKYNLKMLSIIGLAIILFIIWLIICFLVGRNGRHDFFWGPADTGLFFVSNSSLTINYLIFSLCVFGSIISPIKLFKDFTNKLIAEVSEILKV